MHVVLIHIWSFQEQDAKFWNDVSKLLEQKNNKLVLTGYSNGSIFDNYGIPYIYLRNAEVPGCIYDYNNEIGSNLLSDEQIDEIIRFEELWRSTSVEDKKKLKQNINYYSYLYYVFLQILKPSIILIWNGYHPIELILRHIAKLQSIPACFIERGPINGTLFFDKGGILNDSEFFNKNNEVTILNEPDKDKWQAFSEQVIDNYNRTNKTWWPQPQLSSSNSEIVLNSNHRKIILFAEQINNDTQNFLFSPNFKKNIDALIWFCNQNIDFNKYIIVFKKHPKSHVKKEFFEPILQNKGIYVDDIPLDKCFELADYVVAVNSTILHESLMKQKPALSLGYSILSDKNILYDLTEITSSDHVNQTINQWLNAHNFDARCLNYKRYLAIMIKKSLIASEEGQSIDYDVEKLLNFIDENKNHEKTSSNLLIEYTANFFNLVENERKNAQSNQSGKQNNSTQSRIQTIKTVYLKIKNAFA